MRPTRPSMSEVVIVRAAAKCFWVLVLFAVLAAPAAAQVKPAGTVAAGYSFVFDTDATLPTGWLGAATFNVHDIVGLTAESAGNYGDVFGVSSSLHTVMAGARIGRTSGSGVRPFGQFLVGMSRYGALGFSESFLTLDLGAGVDVPVGERVAVRIQFDQQVVSIDAELAKQYRLAFGAVFAFGSR